MPKFGPQSNQRKPHKDPAKIGAFARLVRETRLARGETQQELAVKVGNYWSAVARWEGGHVTPTLPTLIKLSKALGLSLSRLVRAVEEDEKCPPKGPLDVDVE